MLLVDDDSLYAFHVLTYFLWQAGLPRAKGASLDIVVGDITQKQTLLPEIFDSVRAAIVCSAVVVSPKEGDTEDREKYYQVWPFLPSTMKAFVRYMIISDTINDRHIRELQALMARACVPLAVAK